MIVKFYNISWDTDGESVDIPNEVKLDVDLSSDEIEYYGADELSDKYGWCVNSFQFEIQLT